MAKGYFLVHLGVIVIPTVSADLDYVEELIILFVDLEVRKIKSYFFPPKKS